MKCKKCGVPMFKDYYKDRVEHWCSICKTIQVIVLMPEDIKLKFIERD